MVLAHPSELRSRQQEPFSPEIVDNLGQLAREMGIYRDDQDRDAFAAESRRHLAQPWFFEGR